eukprot:4903756-Lingulodinium_polyedra.AAC.1
MTRESVPPPAAEGAAASPTGDEPPSSAAAAEPSGTATAVETQPSPFTRESMIAATGDMLKKAFPLPAYRELVESVL